MQRGRVLVLLIWLLGRYAGLAQASPQYQYRLLPVPGSIYSYAWGINNQGQIVGQSVVGDGVNPGMLHGFLLDNGAVTTIDDPDGQTTIPRAINDAGQIVGTYQISPGELFEHAFLLNHGSYATIDPPAHGQIVFATGVNNSGQIVGSFTGSNDVYHGFEYAGGQFRRIDVSGLASTETFGINNAGEIVGGYITAKGRHAFLLANEKHTVFDYPGSPETTALAINNQGDIVGDYVDASGIIHGFVLRDGLFTSLDVPGARYTVANGINDLGADRRLVRHRCRDRIV